MSDYEKAARTLGRKNGSLIQAGILGLDKAFPALLLLAGAFLIVLAFAVDVLGKGGLPGFGARQLALVVNGLALGSSGITLLLPLRSRVMGEWALIAVAAFAAALAADFITINTGLPKSVDKLGMLAMVAFSILVTHAVLPASRAEEPHLQGRLMLLWDRIRNIDGSNLAKFIGIALQLGLIALLVGQYSLENEVFSHNLMLLVFFGFVFHYLLPLQYRLPFFLLLSFTAILGTFGLVDGSWLVILGLVLIGIAHLPLAFTARIVLMLVAGALLALLRVDWFPLPWSRAIWPILGSMFMFRMIVYLYELKHQKEPFNPIRTFSYFFLLPNVVFPLFPVIDYANYKRTYYDSDRYKIYQTGITWILNGAFQLILYRFISYNLLIAPEEVTNVFQLIRYLVTNISLYLRVSGQFHIIVGILHLFGFNLPKTNYLYFLASSFTDYWRRINIYWKDFMMKVFFYPAYFRLKKWRDTTRLVVAILFVFFITWLLHVYQWFWLRGNVQLSVQDVLFWGILATLVVANSLYEASHGRQRNLGVRSWTWRDIPPRALKIAGTFTVVCILWSLWTSVSLREWIALWSITGNNSLSKVGMLPIWFSFALVGGGLLSRKREPKTGETANGSTTKKEAGFFRSAAISGVFILALFLVGNRSVYSHFDGKLHEVMRDLTVNRLNEQDADLLERGYYEDLIGVNRFNSQLWEVYMKRPQHRPEIWATSAGHLTGDFMEVELNPSASVTFYDKTFTTNRWGMRDRDYELNKPSGTYRIALLGASTPMGWGVADDETFENILEDRLNREFSASQARRYEILNFSVQGYSTIQNLVVFENKAVSFNPDVLLLIIHPKDDARTMNHLVTKVLNGVELPYEYLNEIVVQEQVHPGTAETLAKRRLNPYGEEISLWAYRRFVEESQRRGILPVMVVIPRIVGVDEPEEVQRTIEMGRQAGFTVIDLSQVYSDQDVDSILLAPWDWHPNAAGHRVIADKMYQALLENKDRILLDVEQP